MCMRIHVMHLVYRKIFLDMFGLNSKFSHPTYTWDDDEKSYEKIDRI